jgi:protein TonB
MTKGFSTHLFAMFVMHALIVLGSWKAVESSEALQKAIIPKFGNGIMKMKVASGLFMSASRPVQKVISKPIAKPVVTSKPVMALPAPKTLPVKAAEPVVAEASSGSASGRADGTGGNPNGHAFGNSNSGTGKFTVMDLYKAELRATIDKNKYYPTLSKRLGQTGVVVIAFTLLSDGNIVDVRIEKPSQYERLNVSALDAVKKVERFKPIPKEAGEEKMDIQVPVKFVTI